MTTPTTISTGPPPSIFLWKRYLLSPTPEVPSSIDSERFDPNYLLTKDPLEFAKLVGFTPDPKQAVLLADAHQRLVVNCTRQWGRTTTVA